MDRRNKLKRFDYKKRIWWLGLFVLSMAAVSGFLFANKDNYVNATLSGWNASSIISDYVMTDYNSMTEAQIQSFLKSKVSCNNTELWRRASTKVTWNIKDGHFVCMADDRFDGETAAHIIKQAAIDYRINPKVLIVTLQKESSLITDSMPHSGQYRTAMGFGCPDTAACDSKYFGLKNQIRNAARFFRAYQDNASGWYKPYWTGNYKVHWHPDLSRCGGVNLNIQNRATASLYSYTPYQPNQAALNAGWGTGDTCSSYGNRNFYNYFTSWFGDTRGSSNDISAEKAILAKYEALGGLTRLGETISPMQKNSQNGIYYQKFQNGYIAGTNKTGYWAIQGSILNYWIKSGQASGLVGAPIGEIKQVASTGMYYQKFQNGYIAGTYETGYWTVRGSIGSYWEKNGGLNNTLGAPKDEMYELKSGVVFQKFKNGFIAGKKEGNLYAVRGSILKKWAINKSVIEIIGAPLDEIKLEKSGVYYQKYETGYVVGAYETGYWFVKDGILNYWIRNGLSTSRLGRPLGDAICDESISSCYQEFQNGYVVGSEKTSYWSIRGSILNYWIKSGRLKSPSGLPLGEIKQLQNGDYYQKYQNGYITGNYRDNYTLTNFLY